MGRFRTKWKNFKLKRKRKKRYKKFYGRYGSYWIRKRAFISNKPKLSARKRYLSYKRAEQIGGVNWGGKRGWLYMASKGYSTTPRGKKYKKR